MSPPSLDRVLDKGRPPGPVVRLHSNTANAVSVCVDSECSPPLLQCQAGLQVVVAPPELHWQSLGSPAYDGSLCGEVRTPEGHMQPMPLSGRRVIAHRAMLAISVPHAIINLGVGMPEVCPPCFAAPAACDSICTCSSPPHQLFHPKLRPRPACSGAGHCPAAPRGVSRPGLAVRALTFQQTPSRCVRWSRACTRQASGAAGCVQGVAQAVGTHARTQNPGCLPLTLTTEVGIVGGFPAGGLRFGAACNAVAALPLASMLDFYNGGGADVACLGMAEVRAPTRGHLPPRISSCSHICEISHLTWHVGLAGQLPAATLPQAGGSLFGSPAEQQYFK